MSSDELTVLVDRLRRDRRRDPYRGRQEYARTARDLAQACEQLLASGEAKQTVPVLRKAVDRITNAMLSMDDSSGIVGDQLDRMMSLYARACAASPPNQTSLAAWLVKLRCDGPGWPKIVLRDFAPALGERGIAEVGRLVAQRAEAVGYAPPVDTLAVAPESLWSILAVRDLREQLAEVSGDVDRYVSVLAEDLVSAVQYEHIVLALRQAGRRQEAIEWARRGLAEKVDWPHADQLRDALVGMLLDDGDTAAALDVRRAEFERKPTVAAYRSLANTAAAVGADDPAPWALAVLNERVAKQPVYASELIGLLLTAGQDEDAWRLSLQHRQWVGESQWLTLLERRGVHHPGEVIGPYQEEVERHILDSYDTYRYQRAVALLPSLRSACQAAGDQEAFPAYVADLRLRHRRRPALLRELDAAGL
ncbi:hypothetical protein [Actinopolymorpha pittospori]